ncbi:hypothetical protein HPB51_013579 [Rhipicephalus microplus]|uniref:Uncharacterized protein n=1 Tax=Rhipicephalus microplus TaxID=6941 RepID=A0A9J6DVH7_RHIMP|nr:hypothetical protein HPB51_013579 [Rhipicephalus microplus]
MTAENPLLTLPTHHSLLEVQVDHVPVTALINTGNLFRLKMFREEQGTWMIMLLTALVFVYMLSLVYNALLLSGHPRPDQFRINALMGVTNASFMKVAACGTWLGDFLTAWMDELYPSWAPALRAFWQSHGRTRIFVFWSVSLLLSAVVISLIVSDHISWDYLNREFVATTELSRAFLASFILVMDLLIVMQASVALCSLLP